MVYTKIKNTNFKPSEYLNNIAKNTYSSVFYLSVYKPQNIADNKKSNSKKIERVNKKDINYDDFKIINKMHIDYLHKLKGNMNCDAFLPVIYRAELTGAEAHVELNSKIVIGFVVEERANSINIISEDGRIRMIIKGMHIFSIKFDGVFYKFLGKNMSNKRFLKK